MPTRNERLTRAASKLPVKEGEKNLNPIIKNEAWEEVHKRGYDTKEEVEMRMKGEMVDERYPDSGVTARRSAKTPSLVTSGHEKLLCPRNHQPAKTPERRKRRRACIPRLPPDVLQRVFSGFKPVPDLCVFAQVCRTWAEAALSKELWIDVKASDAKTRKEKKEESEQNYLFISYEKREPLFSGSSSRGAKKRRIGGKHLRTLFGARRAVDVITQRGADRLRTLDLHDCYPAHAISQYQMLDEDVAKIADRCPRLEVLRLSYSFYTTGQAVVSLTEKCKKLRTLHMTGCKKVTGGDLAVIVQRCPDLEDISMSHCPQFRGHALAEKLFPIRKRLKRIDISDTPTEKLDLNPFSTDFPALEEIKLDNCTYMYLSGAVPSIDEIIFPRLKLINIDKIAKFPLNWLTAMCERCPALRVLSASDVQTGHFGVGHLFLKPIAPLNYLSLTNQALRDRFFQSLFERLRTTLVQMDLSGNALLSCELLSRPGEHFTDLEQLNIAQTAVTDSTLRTLIQLSPMLNFLDASGCRSVKDRTFRRNPLQNKHLIMSESVR